MIRRWQLERLNNGTWSRWGDPHDTAKRAIAAGEFLMKCAKFLSGAQYRVVDLATGAAIWPLN